MGWDNAYRSLWRTLEKLDSVRTDRFCWTDGIKSLQRLTAKFEGGKKVGTLSYDTIQKVLVEFSAEGLISLQFQNEEGDYRGLFGFYVAGQDVHDALCERKGRTCRFIGWNKLPPPIKLGQHYKDEMCFAEGSHGLSDTKPIAPQSGGDREAIASLKPDVTPRVPTTVPTLLEKVPRVVPTLVPRVVPTLLGKSADNSADTKTPQEAQNVKVAPMEEKSGLRFGAPNHGIKESSQSLEAINESNEPPKSCSQGAAEESQHLKAGNALSLLMTDQSQNQNHSHVLTDPLRKLETIGEHFGYTVTLEQITEGEIREDKIDKYGLRVDWAGLRECCQEVKDEWEKRGYLGLKTNGNIMAEGGVRWTARNRGAKVDKFWWAVAAKFREAGGPSKYERDPEVQAPVHSIVFIRAAEETGIDLTPVIDQLKYLREVQSYRDGWNALCFVNPNWPHYELLEKLRDWLFENDAMPDKPPAPPWK